jgi:hypothetical protein
VRPIQRVAVDRLPITRNLLRRLEVAVNWPLQLSPTNQTSNTIQATGQTEIKLKFQLEHYLDY